MEASRKYLVFITSNNLDFVGCLNLERSRDG